MSLLSKTKAPGARGCILIFIAKKVMTVMQAIGIVVRASLFAENHSMRKGLAS
jgi:hypothetical protein